MKIDIIDLGIILLYFAVIIVLGILVSRRSIKDINSYFLGSNSLPWWMLGVSNASGMFDIAGTMWLVYTLFVYGLKGVWLKVNPLPVLVSILVGASIGSWIGGTFGGFVAALLAIPAAGALQVTIREIWQVTAPEPTEAAASGRGA